MLAIITRKIVLYKKTKHPSPDFFLIQQQQQNTTHTHTHTHTHRNKNQQQKHPNKLYDHVIKRTK